MEPQRELSEVDLVGFDELWDVSYDEAHKFVKARQDFNNNSKDFAEVELMNKELDDKNFEIQKLSWQLSEREKELKNLYEELHRLMELNKKLNSQLQDYERLTAKQEAVIDILSTDPKTQIEPILPKF